MKYVAIIITLLSLSVQSGAASKAHPTELDSGLVNPGYHEKPIWFKDSFLDIREDVEEALEQDKRIILYFYQDGCPYCAKLLNDNFGNREISEKTQKHFDVIAINMWGDREVTDFSGKALTEKQFASELRVQYTPTLLMLNEQGKVLLRINGYFAPHKFNVALDYVSQKREGTIAFRDYYRQASPTKASGKLNKIGETLPHPLNLAKNRKKSHRPLLVLFEQHECADCDVLHKDVLQRPALGHAMTNIDIAQVDMWSKELMTTPDGRQISIRDWANELNVKYAPSLVFFDKVGNEAFRTEAFLKTFHVHGAIDYVVSGGYDWQPNFQRYLQHRTEALRARGFEVDLMN